MVLQTLAALLLAPAVLACIYQVFLAVAGFGPRRRGVEISSAPSAYFAIVIPAHNEETTVPDVIRACGELDYPPEKIKVYVVADNCTDRTATIASRCGAITLRRHDEAQRGKGHALAWALPRVLEDRPDAVIILDADCRLSPYALRAFDRHLQAGESVLQASYVSDNPDAGLVSYVAGVANLMENDLFYAPKSRLGLAVLLRGTGMVFRRDILDRCPWNAGSIVEDAEYTLRLSRAGVRVSFVEDAEVFSAFPTRKDQLAIQRSRWIGGTAALARTRSIPLMLEGLRRGQVHLFDLGWTLLVCLRSLVVVELLAATLLSLLAAAWQPGPQSTALCLIAATMIILYGGLFAAGALKLGLSRRRLRFLGRAPRIVLRLLMIAGRSVVLGQPARWERTPR